MISITTAKEEDIQRIMEIERGTISPPWTEGSLLGEVCRNDSFFPLAVENGTVLGFLILRRVSDEGELFQIAVDSAARRRGVGDMLMRAALGCAEESGLIKVYLEVRKSNEAAIALYGKHGFTSEGRRKNYYVQPVEDALVMVREMQL